MLTADRSNFHNFIRNFPKQIRSSKKLVEGVSFFGFPNSFDHLLLLGMGGSAMAGDLLWAALINDLSLTTAVNRDYDIPSYIGPKSLVLASSYSGNTEETLSATRVALERGAKIITISSGGQLKKLAVENSLPFIQLPEGFPPRQALGHLFFPLLHALHKIGLVPDKSAEIEETLTVVDRILEHNDPVLPNERRFCSNIATHLYRKIPVLYTAAEHLKPIGVRWRNQFNENSKILSFSNQFPELNHNEIMGWEADQSLLSCFSILLLRDSGENPRNRTRLEISRNLWRKKTIPVFEVFSEGRSLLARMFSLIYIGDWVSYYLALLYGKDPIKIDSIQLLKDRLAQIK